jgi:hypothetical protein
MWHALERNTYKLKVGKVERTRQLERPRSRYEDDIKTGKGKEKLSLCLY